MTNIRVGIKDISKMMLQNDTIGKKMKIEGIIFRVDENGKVRTYSMVDGIEHEIKSENVDLIIELK